MKSNTKPKTAPTKPRPKRPIVEALQMLRECKKAITWKMVDNLAAMQCSSDEIAFALGVARQTIDKACKRDHGTTLGEYVKQRRLAGHIILRRLQLRSAQRGDIRMQIHLGKNWLGQTDKAQITGPAGGPIEITVIEAVEPKLNDD